ncbi:hypothetical protein K493DRAFT_315883 [Basidiobolus meristosporus CBS 931.73]|uniref:Mitochondrial cytochrome c oxidase assembly factor n=1 Tax=Basidiobolus meristosporus CBS 931.73 TaxID=1314790 RepID=A0A1Y1Y6L2_9FUNG|nr:hypothetical protein K493DRAFT_315883 [Basidiobolus meristosporus CBS 931.73]|eukprot:ORX93660.1 hypothetical protein K493DRAFT_315883 [Basidiobolus meristosporus CBS 931.73]
MGTSRLEVFKFGVYVFFPVAVMLYFGHQQFYDKYLDGVSFYPPAENCNVPANNKKDLQEQLAQLRAERLAKKRASHANESEEN